MPYMIILSEEALEGAKQLRKSNPQSFKKLSRLIEELKDHPYTGTGRPEQLKYLPGLWSRHIDRKNRLIYTVKDEEVIVTVISVIGHYDDK